jgi:hypothetical protein
MDGSDEKRPKPRETGNFGAPPASHGGWGQRWGPQLKMRIVSAGAFWPSRRGLSRFLKYIVRARIPEFESFCIGADWCQALSDCSVDLVWDVPRRVLASLRDRHLGPPIMGSGGCGGPIYGDVLAVRLAAGIRTRNGLASSIVPAGDIAPPVGGFAFSPVVFLLCTTRYMPSHAVRSLCARCFDLLGCAHQRQ